MFTEAMNFLIEEEHDPGDMMYLGGYYYEIKRFDLALKYYEMAATYDYDPAYEGLAYIWYYGRTGERDFKKAFEYFSKLMEKGDPVSTYKVSFIYEDNEQSLESVMEGNECTVCFNGKWFHSRDDFFKDACIGNTKLTAIYDKLYGFEVKD